MSDVDSANTSDEGHEDGDEDELLPPEASRPSDIPARRRAVPLLATGGAAISTQWVDFLQHAQVQTTAAVSSDVVSATSTRFWGLGFSSKRNSARFNTADY
jgi:hypothetical protein